MIRIVKNFDKVGLFILGLVCATVFAAKAVEMFETEQWYNVTITGVDPEVPANQSIGSALGGNPTGDCSTLKDSLICAIRLRLGDGVDKPSTVQQALDLIEDNEDLEITGQAFLFDSE